jgi:hypothetical protein
VVGEATRLPLLRLRDRPTVELLRQVSFTLAPASFGLPPGTLPFGGDFSAGQYLRNDDSIRSAIKIDDRVVATWMLDDRFRFEAGYFLTYLSAEGSTPSYLRQGPWCGLSFQF